MIKVMHEDGIGYSLYSEKRGRYYVTHYNFWEKGGYPIAGRTNRISKAEFERVKRNDTVTDQEAGIR